MPLHAVTRASESKAIRASTVAPETPHAARARWGVSGLASKAWSRTLQLPATHHVSCRGHVSCAACGGHVARWRTACGGHVASVPPMIEPPFHVPFTSVSHPFRGSAPYWRGPIWINLNYLTLAGLPHYATREGPARERAAAVYAELRDNLLDTVRCQQIQRLRGTFHQYTSSHHLIISSSHYLIIASSHHRIISSSRHLIISSSHHLIISSSHHLTHTPPVRSL